MRAPSEHGPLLKGPIALVLVGPGTTVDSPRDELRDVVNALKATKAAMQTFKLFSINLARKH